MTTLETSANIQTTTIRYFAGAPRLAGTTLPGNVTGDCSHTHRTPEAAQACIVAKDRSIKRGHGSNAYCDRVVMVQELNRPTGNVLSGTTHVWSEDLEDL